MMIIASFELGFVKIEHRLSHGSLSSTYALRKQLVPFVFFFGEWFLCFVKS